MAGTPFVGRVRELHELSRSLDRVADGQGQLLLLAGEPGIGKTSLAGAVTAEARSRGFLCLWGRCWEDGGAPPYWPWVQILRAYRNVRDEEADPASAPLDIAQLDIAQLVSHVTEGDPAQERFALFDATNTLLQEAARTAPLLLVLDDLHTADHDSLRLLQFLARELRDTRMLVVGTYREQEAAHAGTGTLLVELAREGHILPLRGLTEQEVAAFIERILGTSPSASLATTVHHTTQGNPFFVDAVIRMLAAEDQLRLAVVEGRVGLPMPPSVREAIQRRLRHLSADVRRTLQVASILGRSFTLSLVAELLHESTTALLDRLRVPLAWNVVVPDADVPGRYAFSHMLLRETLYSELAAGERLRLHEQAGTAMEAAYANDLTPHLTEVAHQFLHATAGNGVDRAVEYATRAADHVMTQAAYEEAGSLYARAIGVLESAPASSDPRLCNLLLALGAARTRAGDTVDGRQTYLDAAAVARGIGADDQLAAAALGYAGMTGFHFTGRVDPTLVSLLDEALSALPPTDSATRVRLLARLAVALYWSDDDERRVELSERAVTMAARLGDPGTLAMALHSRRYAQWSPGDLEQRLRDATRSLELALEAGDLELAVSARRWRLTDLLELGDVAAVDREIEHHERLAAQLRQPFHLAHTTQFRAMRAFMDGRFEQGEELARAASGQAERAGSRLALTFLATQVFPAWRQQARDAELLDVVQQGYQQAPQRPNVTSGLALVYLETGQRERAAILFDQLSREEFKDLRPDMLLLETLALITPVCVELGDVERADLLYRQLAPFAGRMVVTGAPARACWGPVDHFLGLLAGLGGDLNQAAAHFEGAMELCSRLGAAPLVADTRYEYGRLLLSQGGQRHRDRAATMLTRANAIATELGMARLVRRIEALLLDTPPSAATTEDLTSPLRALQREGDYWTVETARGLFRVQDRKGMQYLEVLLGSPGQEHHVLELAAATATAGATPNEVGEEHAGLHVTSGFGDAGQVLDARAKAAYRQRLGELETLLDEARSFHDDERRAQLEVERQLLVDQLREAVGLGGRDRRAASAAERARVNVTRALRTAIQHLAHHDPDLAAYLDRTILTGTFCVYRPGRARAAPSVRFD